jgi:hypothetical protein
MSLVTPPKPQHASDSAAVLAAAATNFIVANAGEWAATVESYVPGLVAAQMAALAAHKLQIK